MEICGSRSPFDCLILGREDSKTPEVVLKPSDKAMDTAVRLAGFPPHRTLRKQTVWRLSEINSRWSISAVPPSSGRPHTGQLTDRYVLPGTRPYRLVRQVAGTWTARYQAVPPKTDRRQSISAVGD
ncbi:hypothetical protein BHM03_00053172 [Ensete ventricosum]|nr:hypothetical protein BHM03_00053172 [Ensete ventricosum]